MLDEASYLRSELKKRDQQIASLREELQLLCQIRSRTGYSSLPSPAESAAVSTASSLDGPGAWLGSRDCMPEVPTPEAFKPAQEHRAQLPRGTASFAIERDARCPGRCRLVAEVRP